MGKNKFLKVCGVSGVILAFSFALFINHNLKKQYKPDEFIPEENAYFGGVIEDEAGHIKAHKYVTPTDNKYNSQKTRSLGTSLIGDIESVWSSYTGKGTTVAIIDDGFDVNHPEYRRSDGTSAILSTSRYYYASGGSYKYKKYTDDPTCIEEDWEEGHDGYEWGTHGTNTSTTAAAPMNNGGGVGIAPDADILALKIDFTFVAIEAAIRYAISEGVDVINMSLGAYSESFVDGWGDSQSGSYSTATYLNSACQAAYDAGIIVVAAAGNESTWHKSYPACNTKVIGVGALGDWDNKGNATQLAEFTNYVKSDQTGEINVDILAPGYVYTASKEGTENSPTHTYNDTQGTSFSSPIVAGAACLWKEKYPNGTPDEFLTQLQSTADGIGYYTNKMIPVSGWYSELTDVGPSNITNGRLNVANLLDIDEPYVLASQDNISICVGETKQINTSVSNGSLTYSSSNTNVATVSNSGLVEGVGAGNATITITATKNGHTATDTVSVHVDEAVAATSLVFNPKSITLNVGDTYNAEEIITLTPNNASRVFLFSSGNDAIATVDDETGLITAVSAGSTEIDAIAIYGEGYDTLSVTVNGATPHSGSITFGSGSGDLNVNSGTVNGNDSLSNSWTVTTSGTNSYTPNADYAQIGSSSKPATSITFSMSLASSATFTNVSASFGGFSGSSASVAIKVGSTTIGAGTVPSSDDVNVTNSSTASGTTLSIELTNIAKGIKAYSISYTYTSGGAAPTPTVSSVTVSPSSLALDLNGNTTGNLTATVNGTNSPAQTVNWSSGNNSVATVSSSGVVTAVAIGSTTITATSTVDNTKSGTCTVTVTDSSNNSDYSGSFTYDNKGTAWTLTNCEDASNYWRCPDTSHNTSVAVFPGVFTRKDVTSAVKITIENATYNTGGDPTSSTFAIYSDDACTNQVDAVQSGSLPNSSTYKNTIYTISQANAIASFEDDLVILITKPGKQIRLRSITIEFNYDEAPEKIIESLSASYSGPTIYVGGSLDESKVSVTASFTEDRYSDALLNTNDYSLTGFSSATAGNKIITVTYTGALTTTSNPMTTTFNVEVIEDTITNVTVSCNKVFHPGDVINKSNLTVTVTYLSGAITHPDDYTFANDGYRFTYADAPSGGSNDSKGFSISYAGGSYNFSVTVNRVAYVAPTNTTLQLTGTQGQNAGIEGTGAGQADDYNTLVINGVTCSATQIYVYNASGTKCFSFGKGIGEIHNTVALNKRITSLDIVTAGNNPRTDGKLYVSTNGSTWVLKANADFENVDYRYFKIAYETTSNNYSNISTVTIGLVGVQSISNVANYIMYADNANQCTSKTTNALNYFNALSKADRATFMIGSDYVIATARERLLAWAAHEGKTIMLSNGDYVVSSSRAQLNSINDDSVFSIAIIVGLATLVALSGFLYFKKRKDNK